MFGAGASKAGGTGKGGGSTAAARVVDTVAISSSDRDLIRGLMDMDEESTTDRPDDAVPTPADGSQAQDKHRKQTAR